MIEQLIYVSRPKTEWDTLLLINHLNRIYEHNKKNSITGCMIYKSEYFMQYIEGSKKSVCRLFDRIKLDPRHEDIAILFNEQSKCRIFHDFKLSFKNMAFWKNIKIKGFSPGSKIAADSHLKSKSLHQDTVISMLNNFLNDSQNICADLDDSCAL